MFNQIKYCDIYIVPLGVGQGDHRGSEWYHKNQIKMLANKYKNRHCMTSSHSPSGTRKKFLGDFFCLF